MLSDIGLIVSLLFVVFYETMEQTVWSVGCVGDSVIEDNGNMRYLDFFIAFRIEQPFPSCDIAA